MEDEDLSEHKGLVCDNGSGTVKAGFSGDDAPRIAYQSLIGYPKQRGQLLGMIEPDFFVGDEAQRMRGIAQLTYPIKHGTVQDWDAMEKIWHHTFFNELRISDASEYSVLTTEAPLNAKPNREKIMEYMFEKFGFSNFYIALQAVLALYSSGRTTGVVMDSGAGVSHAVPVYEGVGLPHAIGRLEIAGREITDYFQKIIAERCGFNFTTSAELEIVRDMKEKYAYVAQDFEDEAEAADTEEGEAAIQKKYVLPDGNEVIIDDERFKCTEPLFKPQLIGREAPGIHELIWNSIAACEIDVRKNMYPNVILSGGSSLFPGLVGRMEKELKNKVPEAAQRQVKIFAPPERQYSVWIGGSVLSSLSTFEDMWIAEEEYQEYGKRIVHEKCF